MHLYPVNPATISRFRQAFAPSYAKSDITDADLICEVLKKHRDRLRQWIPDDACTRKIDKLTQIRRKRVETRTRFSLQLTARLKTYFPQVLGGISKEVVSPVFCKFLRQWPTPIAAKSAPEEGLRRFFHQNHCRRVDVNERRIKAIKTFIPITKDQAIIDIGVIDVQMLCEEIEFLSINIRKIDQIIDKEFMVQQDVEIFTSFPGAGAVNAPKLAVAFGTDRNRFESAQAISTYCGIAPVVESSGKQYWVHMRRNAPIFKKQTFHEFAACSINYSKWASAFYQMKRSKGFKHHATIRALAFKWTRIMYRCWQDKKPYDENQYIVALAKSGSPILNYMKESITLC
jgi:transposase